MNTGFSDDRWSFSSWRKYQVPGTNSSWPRKGGIYITPRESNENTKWFPSQSVETGQHLMAGGKFCPLRYLVICMMLWFSFHLLYHVSSELMAYCDRMVTGALLQRGRRFGTLCRLNCKVVTLLDNTSSVWRHSYSGRGTTALYDSL